MKRTWVYDKQGKSHEVTSDAVFESHYVQPDIAEFRSNDGAVISGRAAWREHLKSTDSVEMGHADLKHAREQWNKRQEAFQARLKRDTGFVKPVEMSVTEAKQYEMSRINREVANRLEGRPTPDRKTLIQLTIETAKQYRERR